MSSKLLRLIVMLSASMLFVGCYNRLVFRSPDLDKYVTVFNGEQDRYVFVGQVEAVRKGLRSSTDYIKLSTSSTTEHSDALFLCWGREGDPIEFYCPKTTIDSERTTDGGLIFLESDPLTVGEKYHSDGCFEYGFTSGAVFPKKHAVLLE